MDTETLREDSPWIVVIGLLILAVLLQLAGVETIAGFPLANADRFASGYIAAGDFSIGVFAAGTFAAGIFAAGIFSVGIFSIGVFSIGIFSIGIYAAGIYATQRFISSLRESGNEY